jgi:hypothetical protein
MDPRRDLTSEAGLMEILDSDTRGVLQVADHGSPSGQALSFDEFDGLAAEPRRMVSPRRS